MRLPMYDVRFGEFTRLRVSVAKREAPGGAYVRRTMLDVRFINNVRIAQIFSDH